MEPTKGTSMRTPVATAAALLAVVLLAGCSGEAPAPRPSASATPASAPTASAEASEGPVTPTGEVTVIAEGLDAPWSVVRLDDAQVPGGAVLVSERDTGAVREVTDAGLRT